jgi:Alw26I/Eco31I/Esp3I family type II restriction endonuclease
MSEEAPRFWHPNFKKYTDFIVKHPNYKGLFFEYSADGNVKWVVTGKSDNGLKRRSWWDAKCRENKIKIEPGCYAKIALVIHPTKKHVCQICGKSLVIEYVYPNKRLINSIKKEFGVEYAPYDKTIFDIVNDLVKNVVSLNKFLTIFKISGLPIKTREELNDYIYQEFTQKNVKAFLSPGVMSNSPDRFDGFHSDGNCCRSVSDKGRHKDNLSRYGQDRRVYENWADGNWKMADRLMSEFSNYGLSADHIGPISLGFCHRPKFQPMTREQNSTKNNRMSFNDVKILMKDESEGDKVISWHSRFIWDNLKGKVKNDKDAVKLSSLMRVNLHHILTIFSIIKDNGYERFLKRLLHPEYSFYDYKFVGFNPKDGTYKEAKAIERTGKNQQNNVGRYLRIAFDELDQYRSISNRKTKELDNTIINKEIEKLLVLLKDNKNQQAFKNLQQIFKILADQAVVNW